MAWQWLWSEEPGKYHLQPDYTCVYCCCLIFFSFCYPTLYYVLMSHGGNFTSIVNIIGCPRTGIVSKKAYLQVLKPQELSVLASYLYSSRWRQSQTRWVGKHREVLSLRTSSQVVVVVSRTGPKPTDDRSAGRGILSTPVHLLYPPPGKN